MMYQKIWQEGQLLNMQTPLYGMAWILIEALFTQCLEYLHAPNC